MITPRQARHGRPLPSATISLVVCVAVATFQPVEADERSEPRERADAERLSARQGLNEFLVRDREYRVLLSQAETAISDGRISAALEALQSVLDADHDVFLWPEEGGPPVSARAAAGRILRQLPPAARSCYERRHGDSARQLWDRYRHAPDPALLAELLYRYSGTQAGGEALSVIAQLEMDRGNMPFAAGLWDKLLSDPGLAGQVSVADRVRAQIAFNLSGTGAAALLLPPDLARQRLTLAGTSRSAAEWVRQFVDDYEQRAAADPESTPPEWCLPFGGAGVHRRTAGSRPVHEPLWSASYLAPAEADGNSILRTAFATDSDREPELAAVVAQWTSTRREQRAPLAAASFPIVVGGLVVARDYSHITARDVRTGAVAWRYPCASSVHRVFSELGQEAARSPVPAAISRAADRPSAMFAFDAAFAENSVVGMLTSDGRRVFAIDAVESESTREAPHAAADGSHAPPRPLTNRLIALKLQTSASESGGQQLWAIGGSAVDGAPDSVAGCFFLGPPTPDGDRLFVVAEFRRELHLLALDAATGRLLWRQPVSLVDIPLDGDPLRARLACCPAVAQGIVVCPTQLGTLVGVDAATGTLLWVYSYVEEAGPHHVGRWQHAANRRFGSAAFPDLPLVVDNRVLVLPHQSEFAHCLDLHTGAALWPPQPRDGALFAAAGNSDTLLLIGARYCIARHLDDGRLLWKAHIDTPLGRGVLARDHYLLPTARGAVLSLQVSTGRALGNLLPASSRVTTTVLRPAFSSDADFAHVGPAPDDDEPLPLGNLCMYEDLIVTATPTGIAAFPQAEVALQALLDRLPADHAAPADLLRAAELQLQLGRHVPAAQFLRRVLAADPPVDIRTSAENDLRELLYTELADSADPAATLSALAELAGDPGQRGRYLVARLSSELNSGDARRALGTVREALQLEIDRPVVMTAGGEYLAHPLRCMSTVLARSAAPDLPDLCLRATTGAPVPFNQDIVPSQLDLFGALPGSGPIRLRAAAAALQSGRFQAAELLLLAAVADPDPETAVAAAVMLSTFWEDRGLSYEALDVLDRLSSRRGRIRLNDGATINDHLAHRLAGRSSCLDHGVPTTSGQAPVVTIEQTLCPEGCPASDRPCDCDLLNHLFIGNREFARLAGATLRVIDRGIQPSANIDPATQAAGTPSRAVRLTVVDRSRLSQTATIDLPPHAWRAGAMERYDAGHLLPVVGADVCGISLLEGRVLWSLPAESFDPRDRPCLGPYGPGYCIVQAGGTLTALDPADGRVLWRRSDLDYDAGLVTDDETGLIGDDRIVAVFDADRLTYRVIDTRSGQLLRTGTLDASPGDLHKRRWNFGRRLLFTSSDRQQTRLRVWDPLDDTCPVDVVAGGRLLHHESCRDGLLTTLDGNTLTILDVDTNQVLWSHQLDAEAVEGVRLLNVYSDRRRHYVHLERDVSQGRYNHLNGEVRVPHLQVEGELLGIDRVTGRFWRRTLPRCNLLLLPQHRLPFLVGISRIRDAEHKQSSMLMVQVIDAATGDLLQQREDLVKTSIVHTACDPVAGRLDLAGIGSRIQIHFVSNVTGD